MTVVVVVVAGELLGGFSWDDHRVRSTFGDGLPCKVKGGGGHEGANQNDGWQKPNKDRLMPPEERQSHLLPYFIAVLCAARFNHNRVSTCLLLATI
jgi:hypothetical protein